MSIGRDYEVGGMGAMRLAYDSSSWTEIDLETVAVTNSITPKEAGSDLAFVYLENMSASILGIRLREPGMADPAYTDRSIIIGRHAQFDLPKVRGLKRIWVKAAPAHSGTIQVMVGSYRISQLAPW